MTVVETVDLTRRFGDLVAVDHLNLAVDGGEVFGLLGPNGAGKTTVIKMLTTLLVPTSGRAMVGGFDAQRDPVQVRCMIGYVPQLLSADGQLTGYENLQVFARLYEVPRAEREARIRDALEGMKLADVADRMVSTYSGGMIRRLEIAQSLMHRPRVLFLDEPTVGLDPIARHHLWEQVEGLRAELGTTIFVTTHYMEEAEAYCGRVAIMHQGQVQALGTPDELKQAIGAETLEEVFEHHAGSSLESGSDFRATSLARRTARRLG